MRSISAIVRLAVMTMALTGATARAVWAQAAAQIVATGRSYGNVQAAAFHSDGTLLALAGSNRRIYLIDTKDGKEKHDMLFPESTASALAFAPRSHRLAAGGYQRVYIWDSANGQPDKAIETGAGRTLALAYAPDGQSLAVAGSDRSLRIFSVSTATQTVGIATGGSAAQCLAFSADGRFLAAGGDRYVAVWSADSGEERHRLALPTGRTVGVAFAPDGYSLLLGRANGEIEVRDLDQTRPRTVAKDHTSQLLAMDAAVPSRLLASASRGKILYLHHAKTLKPLHKIDDLDAEATCIALSPDGRYLAVGLRGIGRSYTLWRLNPQLLQDGGGVLPIAKIEADYLSELEKAILHEQNLARGNPSAYAEFAREYRIRFQGNLYVSGRRRFRTKEGLKAVDEAIAFLVKTRAVPPLAPSRPLSLAARDHVKDTGPKGLTGHDGSDGSRPADRIARHGKWKKTCGENIAYGHSIAREIVLQLIIDDGVPDRGHRRNMFNPDFKVSGVHVGPHKVYRVMSVITYAGGISE
jgi:uncharacterized protein YkwD